MEFIQYSGSTTYLLDISMTRKKNSHLRTTLNKKSALHSSIMLWFVAVAKNRKHKKF